MLRRLTATLAIGGLLAGLNATLLLGQELVPTDATPASWDITTTNAEESPGDLLATPTPEIQMADCVVCETQGCDTLWDRCFGGDWFLDGWVEQGYTANPDHPGSNFNNPLGFNDRADDYQLNQVYLTFGKNIEEDCCWDFGFRTDVLYGSDYFFLESDGLERNRDGSRKWNGGGPRMAGTRGLYGLALPQAYVESYIPIGNGLKTKFGHFYSILGYESAPAPENFFYSHSYTYVYGVPKTHTGFISSYDLTSNVTVQAGMTNGWDNFENINGSYGFLFGTNWTNGISSLAFAMHTGSEDNLGRQNRYSHTLVYTRKLNSRWNYAFEHDYGVQNNLFLNNTFTEEPATFYSFVNYLYYQWSDEVTFGARLEWFRDEDNSRIQQIPIQALFTGSNYYNFTLGANWKPCDHVLVRPEARYDWSNLNPLGTTGVYDDFTKDHMYTFAVDVILYF